MSLISIGGLKTAWRWKRRSYEGSLAVQGAAMEPYPPWQAGLGQDALLQRTVQCATGTRAPGKGGAGAEGADWKDAGASKSDSDFGFWCFFSVVCGGFFFF